MPRYGLGNYILQKPAIKPTKEEEVIIANLSVRQTVNGFEDQIFSKGLKVVVFIFNFFEQDTFCEIMFFSMYQNNLLLIGKNISQNLDDFLEDSDTDNNGEEENKSIYS